MKERPQSYIALVVLLFFEKRFIVKKQAISGSRKAAVRRPCYPTGYGRLLPPSESRQLETPSFVSWSDAFRAAQAGCFGSFAAEDTCSVCP